MVKIIKIHWILALFLLMNIILIIAVGLEFLMYRLSSWLTMPSTAMPFLFGFINTLLVVIIMIVSLRKYIKIEIIE